MSRLNYTILFFLFPLFLFAQKEAKIIDPSVEFHIQNKFDTLKLPPLQWILQEGKQPLSHENLLNGNIADAKLIDLKNEPIFSIKAHQNYWFKIKLTSEIDSEFGLAFHRIGDCFPFEITFKDVKTFARTGNRKTALGLSGTAAPASRRDYSKLFIPSAIRGEISTNEQLEIWCKVLSAERCDVHIDLELINAQWMKTNSLLQKEPTVLSFFRGACLVLLFLAFFLFFWSKEQVYLWFMVFLFSLFIFGDSTVYYNVVVNNWFPENPRVVNFLMTFLSASVFSAVLHFGRVFINTKEKFPKIHFTIGAVIVIFYGASLFGTSLRFIPEMPGREFWFVSRKYFTGFGVISTIISIIYLLFSKDTLARFFSIGALLPFVALLYGWYEVNYMLKSDFESNITLIINAGFMLTMTLALAYRFRIIMIQGEQALQDKMNAELANSEQKLRMELASNFFSNITHEFRTPLTLILEPVRQLLRKKTVEKSELDIQLNLVKNNSEKLLTLVNQLLDISKLEGSKMKLNLSAGNLFETIQPIFKSFKLLAEKKDIKLKISTDKQLSSFYFDKNKMERIANNLLSNAIKFTEKGQVKFELKSFENDSFLLRVSDTGIGISDKQLPLIFDKFHQVDESSTRHGEGTGIGLALVKELVELMSGTIHVKSEVGKGTVFEIRLPIIRKIEFDEVENFDKKSLSVIEIPTPAPAEKPILTKVETDSNKPIILLVEDNTELRTFIRQSLKTHFQIIEAANGNQGIEYAEKFIPDLIVSDVMMPEKDGFELTDTLKNETLTSHIPIILLTAKTASDAKIKGLRRGADAYLTKPFNTEELIVRIEMLIEMRRRLQKKYSNTIAYEQTPDIKTKPTETLPKLDLDFMKKVNLIINEKIKNSDLNGDAIAKELLVSRSQFFRKLKALTGMSPNDFIRNFRLDRANDLLKNKEGSIFEISAKVGFRDEKYFSVRFKKRFGISPREVSSK